jgi:hypothetical protein
MPKYIYIACVLTLLCAGHYTPSAEAFFQPDYQNRCTTNFLDAYVPQGLVFQQFFYNYNANGLRIRDHRDSGKFKFKANVSLTQLVYISDIKLPGGFLGGEVILPYVSGHIRTPAVSDTGSGIGDTFVATFIQSDKKLMTLPGRTIPVYWRLLAGAFFPTGKYDHEKAFNPGCHLTTFHTYYAITAFPTPDWSASFRFMYFAHTANKQFGSERDDLRPGQLFNVNCSTSYELLPGIRLGLMGHVWKQTTDDKLNGRHINGNILAGGDDMKGRELLVACGPGVFINRPFGSSQIFMESHILHDTVVRNRIKGNTFQIRAGIIF